MELSITYDYSCDFCPEEKNVKRFRKKKRVKLIEFKRYSSSDQTWRICRRCLTIMLSMQKKKVEKHA